MTKQPGKQDQLNQEALANPQPGDYWHERFSPYFVVVNREGDQFRVLSCMGGPGHYLRKEELNARIEIDSEHWGFDYSKSMLVDHEWIRRAVTYGSIEGFVADVSRSQAAGQVALEWRDWHQRQLKAQIRALTEQWERFTGWRYLKQPI